MSALVHQLQPTTRRPGGGTPEVTWGEIAARAPRMATTMASYLGQLDVSARPATVSAADLALRLFAHRVTLADPTCVMVAAIGRTHIEDFKRWQAARPGRGGKPLSPDRAADPFSMLRTFFERIIEWDYDDAPARLPIHSTDFPALDEALPKFLDDPTAAKFMAALAIDPNRRRRLMVELLARTGMRVGELAALEDDAVVRQGDLHQLRIPVGKLHNDRYIPLHPQLKQLLDDWITQHRPNGLRTNHLLVEHNRPISHQRVASALRRIAAVAGIGNVTAHQLRHTLATQAVNRGMSLDAIAALLGHKTLAMTMIYARIADKTVADEYFAVTEKVEALYGQPRELACDDEGREMRKLRSEMHRRMLGNGYCARPVEMDCHFESICESCSFFVTTIEFRPTLQRQRDDAATKGQIGRQKIFDGILDRLDTDAS